MSSIGREKSQDVTLQDFSVQKLSETLSRMREMKREGVGLGRKSQKLILVPMTMGDKSSLRNKNSNIHINFMITLLTTGGEQILLPMVAGK